MNHSNRDVYGASTCDFGFLDLSQPYFEIATQYAQDNLNGRAAASEYARFEIRAAGENVYLSRPLVLQIWWDGNWTDEPISDHLQITTIDTSSTAMRTEEVVAFIVWAGLTYGLLRAVEDGAARFGLRMSLLPHALLVGAVVVLAAGLLYYLLKKSNR